VQQVLLYRRNVPTRDLWYGPLGSNIPRERDSFSDIAAGYLPNDPSRAARLLLSLSTCAGIFLNIVKPSRDVGLQRNEDMINCVRRHREIAAPARRYEQKEKSIISLSFSLARALHLRA